MRKEPWLLSHEFSSYPNRKVPTAERLQMRADFAAHLADERRAGRIVDSIPAVLEYGTRLALAEREWDHDHWPAAPPEARLGGRWPGSTSTGTGEHFAVRLDAALFGQVRAACWWTSAEAMVALRTWRDRHPGIVFSYDALDDCDKLSAKVTTVGVIWRRAFTLTLPS